VLDDQFFVFPTADLDAMIDARLAQVRRGLAWRDALLRELEKGARG
jgi:hypothetical protein